MPAILSDCDQLIAEFAVLETREHIELRDKPRGSNFLVHMYQLAMSGDDTALKGKIAVGAQKCGKPYRDEFASGTDFFSLLLAGDKAGLEAYITKLANRRGEDNPVFEGLMRTDAAIKAKICWRRGIEVQIDSPMLPMELMPIKPLERYDDVYDFLNPDWKPPRQGLLGKIERFFK